MEINKPIVSVIVPVYNAEKYLKQCIDSIVEQTYENLEIILVNDGSLDSSGCICDDFATKDQRIKVIHMENAGVSSARNTGLRISDGKYIMFVDADDKITAECIEILVKAIEQYDVDIAFGKSFTSDYGKGKMEEAIVWQNDEALRECLRYCISTFSVWAKLYRKDFIGSTEFSTNIKVNEDALFMFELCCKKPKVVNISDEIYYYRPNENSVSRSKYSDKFEDILSVAERKYQVVKEHFPDLLYLAENTLLKARMNLLKILCVRTRGEKKNLEVELIRYIKKNYKSHILTNKHDDRWIKIIRYNLYYIYKFAYHHLKKRH